MDLKAIGQRIVQVRQELKKNQGEMASLLGISQGMLSQYERGLVEPPLSFLMKVVEVSGKGLEWVVMGRS